MDPIVIEMLFGKRCKPECDVQEFMKASDIVALTSNRGGRQHHSLEPHREEVHDGEVTASNQEVTDSNEDGNFSF
jgi:hypothetical protein